MLVKIVTATEAAELEDRINNSLEELQKDILVEVRDVKIDVSIISVNLKFYSALIMYELNTIKPLAFNISAMNSSVVL